MALLLASTSLTAATKVVLTVVVRLVSSPILPLTCDSTVETRPSSIDSAPVARATSAEISELRLASAA